MARRGWLITGLAALNIALGAALYVQMGGDTKAYGQLGRGGGDLVTLTGHVSSNSILYAFDSSTMRLVALRVDSAKRSIDYITKTEVGEDMERAFSSGKPR